MSGSPLLHFQPLSVFVLVLTRVAGLVMTAPIFASSVAPARVRAFLAVGLSLLIAPLYWNRSVAPPGDLANFAVVLGREALLGAAMGLSLMILFAGLQLSGQIVGQMSGMSLADVFDPSFDASIPVFSQLLDLIALAVFVAIGGHRRVMSALLDTFQSLPPGSAGASGDLAEMLTDAVTHSFALGIRAAAPVMVALLMSVLVMGLINRALPQLNVLVVGFSLNAMIMLAAFSVSLGAAIWVFQEQVDAAIDAIRSALANLEPGG
jgi:flagellar biosynthetic protein FliR